jgi:hypothetical protein
LPEYATGAPGVEGILDPHGHTITTSVRQLLEHVERVGWKRKAGSIWLSEGSRIDHFSTSIAQCRQRFGVENELRKANERLRHKTHVILGCIRQPGFEV